MKQPALKQIVPPPLLTAVGVALLFVALGFFLQLSFLTQMWPWEVGRLSAIFVASIVASNAATAIWVGLTGEYAAMRGGVADLGVMFSGIAIFAFQLYAADNSRLDILYFGIASVPAALACFAAVAMAFKIPFVDTRPMPGLVRFSFMAFAITLLVFGVALVRRTQNVFPWTMSDELLVIYGWIFLGATVFFAYGAYKAVWANAQGQLLGFLVYDLVLIGPYLRHFSTVLPEQRLSLTIYVGVLLYSGALATYFLFVHQPTRLSSFRELRR
jgi:hypothetical protein